MMLSGIDVSSYQSATPDLTGQQFVFIKATEGTSYVNPEQASQAADGRAAGCVVGFYHFVRSGDMQAQASYFVSQCDSVAGDLLVIDWEDSSVSCADKDAILQAVKALRPTHKVLLYCDTSFWLTVDTTSFCQDGLWIADYSHPAGQPGITHPWLFHQYTQSPQDQDVANFSTLADLQAFATGSSSSSGSTTSTSTTTPQWRQVLDHVESIPEKIYETYVSPGGWDNVTQFGAEYGENGVSWCVIFDWDMFHDCNLDSIVPKTDNVDTFTSWAQARGQWSQYPSVGAWVNFGNGAHTEICVGFDSQYVYTKGGNSVQSGATDNGQGNGVWSHQHARTDSYVTGYFAPRFPDNICPPTADPADPRGGKAQTSYSWPGPASTSTTEAHVALTAADAKTLLTTDNIIPAPAPPVAAADYATNKYWTLASTAAGTHQAAREANANTAALLKEVTALSAKVDALSKVVSALNVSSLVDEVKAELGKLSISLTVH